MSAEPRRLPCLLAVLCLCALALSSSGCYLLRSSASSASISVASSSLTSSSALWANNDDQYARDIAALTGEAVESGAGPEQLLRSVGRAAREHGIADWEAFEVTYLAIGVGLREGGLDPVAADDFGLRLCGGDKAAYAAVQRGYRS